MIFNHQTLDYLNENNIVDFIQSKTGEVTECKPSTWMLLSTMLSINNLPNKVKQLILCVLLPDRNSWYETHPVWNTSVHTVLSIWVQLACFGHLCLEQMHFILQKWVQIKITFKVKLVISRKHPRRKLVWKFPWISYKYSLLSLLRDCSPSLLFIILHTG